MVLRAMLQLVAICSFDSFFSTSTGELPLWYAWITFPPPSSPPGFSRSISGFDWVYPASSTPSSWGGGMDRIPLAESIGIRWRLESESDGGMNRNRVAACARIRRQFGRKHYRPSRNRSKSMQSHLVIFLQKHISHKQRQTDQNQ